MWGTLARIAAVAALLQAAVADVCICDDACQQNRICHFGTQEAYTYIANKFFSYTGCPNCLSEVDVCQCDDCNSTSSALGALLYNNIQHFEAEDVWRPQQVCKSPVFRQIMNFNAFPGDSALANARVVLYQLCASSNGVEQNGQCAEAFCHSQISPVCEQEGGVAETVRFLLALYIIVCVFLFTWATEENMAKFFNIESKRDESRVYQALPTAESIAATPSLLGKYL